MTAPAGDDMPEVIGLDVGTSSVKAAVFGAGGRRGAVVRRAVPRRSGPDGRVTQAPDDVRAAVLGAVEAVVRTAERPPDAIAVSAAMHGLVGLDADDEPVTPLVTWADDRAAPVVTEWAARGTAGFLHERTGVPLHPMAPVAKLAWFAEVAPSVGYRVAHWADLKALVIRGLTGTVVTETSSASGWGLMDVRRHTWDDDAMHLAGVAAACLPEVAATTAIRPLSRAAADRVGLASGTPVVLGAADGPLGNVGVGATVPGVAGVSLGTSGAVRVVVDRVPPVTPGLFCYVLDERRWVLGGAVSNGGNIIDWLATTLLEVPGSADDAERAARTSAVIDLAATAPPGADGLVMVPYLVAERAPLWDPSLPGAYLGLRRRHTRAHLARAALEGVCASMGVIADRIDTVVPIGAIRATGGTMRSRLWRQSLAAAVGRPMTVASAEDGSALGAAAVGLVALGAADDLEQARSLLTDDTAASADEQHVSDEEAAAATATRRRIAALGRGLHRVADAYDE